MLVCECGHAGLLPEESVRLKCSVCGRSHEVEWFAGRGAWAAWQRWRAARAPAWRVEFRKAESS